MLCAYINQERIVEDGGLASLLWLFKSRSFDDTICRIAAGAIANLAMNGLSSSSPFFHALYVCVCVYVRQPSFLYALTHYTSMYII